MLINAKTVVLDENKGFDVSMHVFFSFKGFAAFASADGSGPGPNWDILLNLLRFSLSRNPSKPVISGADRW